MAKNNTTKTEKKDWKKIGARILVILLAATFILTSFISVLPMLFA